MKFEFPFERKKSPIFGTVYRPVMPVSFWSKTLKDWISIVLLIDSGADYTLLPMTYAYSLGLDLQKMKKIRTSGVGGEVPVYFIDRFPIRLGNWKHNIPLGFLAAPGIPPLLGRQDFLEVLKVIFYKRQTTISFS